MVLVMEYLKRLKKMSKEHTWITTSLTIMVMLLINYISAYCLIFIWKQYSLHYVVLLITSFLAGVVMREFTKTMIYVGSSFLISATIAVGINVTPLIVFNEDALIISTVIFSYAQLLARIMIISLPLCILSAMLGCFLSESF